MMNNIKIKELMTPNTVVLKEHDRTVDAIDRLLKHHLSGAPVCNHQQQAVGFFSMHDVMVNLWCDDYLPNANQTVGELMNDNVITINAEEGLIDVAEFLVSAKNTLSAISLNGAALSKPSILPVIDNGVVVGVISRHDILNALRPLYDMVADQPITPI